MHSLPMQQDVNVNTSTGLTLHSTSKMCSGCGHLQAMPLYKRMYTCTGCGLVLDRDENSAINILARYFARLGPHTGDPVQCADVFTATEYV